MDDNQQIETAPEAGAAGAPEGAVVEPTENEVGKMYDELGIKAPKPTAKSKKRPKASGVRAKDSKSEDGKDTEHGRKEDDGSKGKSEDAPDTDKDGDSGDDTDSKSQKVGQDAGEVSDDSEDAGDGVRQAESKTEEDSEPGSEKDAEQGDDGAEEEEKGKRPGKSNPEIERRFQKMTADVREREQRIEELERKLQDTVQQQQQKQVEQEDPEYNIDDFRKVRDEEGNIVDLDPERAELAWRRWKEGFEQRKAERDAEFQRQTAIEEYQREASENLMRSSVEAYDTLTGVLDSYPELDARSNQFDQQFSDAVMPIIEEAIIYQPGTEPDNEQGVKPVIVGMRMNPTKILQGMGRIKSAKRNLPLNGVNDNVEVRSNVNVPHSRSSDPTVHAANQLYKELGISKRV